MSEKSEDAFRSIGEVASELGIPQHVLRFWETRFPQVKPLKRGGGRRYYRPEDVALLHGIRFLLYAKGFTIKGVQRLLREQGVRFVAATASGDLRPETAPAPEPVEQPSGEGAQARLPDEERSAREPQLPDDFALAAPPPEPAETAVLPRETEAPERRSGLGSFLKRGPGTSSAASGAVEEQRSAQLQEVILDLLECKRILDQVR